MIITMMRLISIRGACHKIIEIKINQLIENQHIIYHNNINLIQKKNNKILSMINQYHLNCKLTTLKAITKFNATIPI